MPIKIILEDGTERELPGGFPTSQDELNRIISDRIGPKNGRISELEGQVNTLTTERDAAASQLAEKDQQITSLSSQVGEKERALLVSQVSHDKGVPAKWLHGDDRAALEQSADEWLNDARGISGSSEGEEGRQGGGQGYVRSAGTGEEKPARPSYEETRKRAYERAKQQQTKGVLA